MGLSLDEVSELPCMSGHLQQPALLAQGTRPQLLQPVHGCWCP